MVKGSTGTKTVYIDLSRLDSYLSPFFFFNHPATTEIYTLSLHDALPIFACRATGWLPRTSPPGCPRRSEEHTSELQSRQYLVCRLLLEKKKKNQAIIPFV